MNNKPKIINIQNTYKKINPNTYMLKKMHTKHTYKMKKTKEKYKSSP